jgi:hypothetical protein
MRIIQTIWLNATLWPNKNLLMKKLLIAILAVGSFCSCAKIPVQSIQLADAIAAEGARMHSLNLALLDQMFREKKAAVDSFIRNQYTPAFIENIKKAIPASMSVQDALAPVLQRALPLINLRRDSLINTLEEQRVKLLSKLEADYQDYEQANKSLRDLLESAVNIDKEKQGLYDTAKQLSNNHIDLYSIDGALDRFIVSAGSMSGNVADGISKLNEYINKLLNK